MQERQKREQGDPQSRWRLVKSLFLMAVLFRHPSKNKLCRPPPPTASSRCARFQGFVHFFTVIPGVTLRFAPGFNSVAPSGRCKSGDYLRHDYCCLPRPSAIHQPYAGKSNICLSRRVSPMAVTPSWISEACSASQGPVFCSSMVRRSSAWPVSFWSLSMRRWRVAASLR